MSESASDDRENVANQLAVIVRRLGVPGLSLDELATLQKEKEVLLARIMDVVALPPNDAESQARIEAQKRFVDRLMTRQGTVLPDFPMLYRQKARLDRTIWPFRND